MNEKKYPLHTDEQRARFRQTLAYFRSKWVVGESAKLDDAFDDAIQALLNELSGENMTHMDLRQVVITPVVLPHIPLDHPAHTQYIVTVIASVARGYPRHMPQSRGYLKHWEDQQERKER